MGSWPKNKYLKNNTIDLWLKFPISNFQYKSMRCIYIQQNLHIKNMNPYHVELK